jgi:hypothetical protein
MPNRRLLIPIAGSDTVEKKYMLYLPGIKLGLLDTDRSLLTTRTELSSFPVLVYTVALLHTHAHTHTRYCIMDV